MFVHAKVEMASVLWNNTNLINFALVLKIIK